MARLHWIEAPAAGRLAIMARPRANDWLEDDIADWRRSGLHEIVSLLDSSEVTELGLQDEAQLCRSAGLEFLSFPIPDRGLPESLRGATELSERIANSISMGRSVAIHCRAGIGRSSLVAACALICVGVDGDKALALVKTARGVPVPDTDEQREWVLTFAKAR